MLDSKQNEISLIRKDCTMAMNQTQRIIEETKQLSLDELKALSDELLEEIEEREWDRVLQSPEGLADNEREYQKTIEAKKAGNFIEYVPGESLEELYQRRLLEMVQ
jgi:hypothetical protein